MSELGVGGIRYAKCSIGKPIRAEQLDAIVAIDPNHTRELRLLGDAIDLALQCLHRRRVTTRSRRRGERQIVGRAPATGSSVERT